MHGGGALILFSYQKNVFMLIQTSPHLHYRYTNVQLYNQKYVQLLGYIIDTDQTSKQEILQICIYAKVYTSIHYVSIEARPGAELGFHSC